MQKSGQNIVPPELHQRYIPLCIQMKIQVQTVQYQIRPKAKPRNIHVETTKLLQRSVQNIVPLQCFKGISPYMTKCKSKCKQCNIRLIKQQNLRTLMQEQHNLCKRVVRQIIVPPDWIKGTSPMSPNENLNANSAILDLSKSIT